MNRLAFLFPPPSWWLPESEGEKRKCHLDMTHIVAEEDAEKEEEKDQGSSAGQWSIVERRQCLTDRIEGIDRVGRMREGGGSTRICCSLTLLSGH